MTRLIWDDVGERVYEAGVSRGVFYGSDSKGIPWNGLTAVEDQTKADALPLYFDGFKYADLVSLGDFEGKMKAFTYPDEFLPYEGTVPWQDGFYLAQQPKQRFGLVYRTEVANDTGHAAYKLHILYNVLAIPANVVYETMSLGTEPVEFEWDISTIPVEIDKFRPTAHVILDSRQIDPFLLADIEDLLYGTDTTDPVLPELNGFVTFVQKWGRLVIVDNGDGTWTASTPLEGVIVPIDAISYTITSDTIVTVNATTYTISSSEADTGSIWPQ